MSRRCLTATEIITKLMNRRRGLSLRHGQLLFQFPQLIPHRPSAFTGRRQKPRVGRGLAEEWAARRRLAPGVTTPAIDAMLARAGEAGAWAGKVCGAGGGGCLFVLTDPARKAAVTEALTQAGATILPVAIDGDGLRLDWSGDGDEHA